MVSTGLLVETVANGLLLGGIYALAALGLSLVFGIMDIVNLAHGHFLMLGGYVAVILYAFAGVSPLVGMFAAIAVLFLVGIGLQEVVLDRVLGDGLEQPLLVLFGVALVLQNLGQFVLERTRLGTDVQSTDIGVQTSGITVGSVTLSVSRTVTFVVAVVLFIATWIFIRRTRTGQAIRATAENQTAAHYMGIDTVRVRTITLGLGAALAGAAGALLSMVFPVDPFVGWSYLLITFTAVVLGGVGSIPGTFVGGLVLGVSENLGALVLGGSYRELVPIAIFLFVLLVRPTGLFGTEVSER